MTTHYLPTTTMAIAAEQIRRIIASSPRWQAAIPGGDFDSALLRVGLRMMQPPRPFAVVTPGDEIRFDVPTNPSGFEENGSHIVYIEIDVDQELERLDLVAEQHRSCDFMYGVMSEVYGLRNTADADSPFGQDHIDLKPGRLVAWDRSDPDEDETDGPHWWSLWSLKWGVSE